METKLAVALALMAVVHSLPYASERKCVPSLYKSDYIGQVGEQTQQGESTLISVMGTAYYDVEHKIQVNIQMVKGEGFSLNQTYITDDNTRMSYSIDNESGKCVKWPNKAKPVEVICNDSPDLVLVGSLRVGGFMLDTYNYDIDIGMMTATFERESFTLLNAVVVQTISGIKQMVAMQFGNMSTTDIPASVWKIPDSCNN